MKRIKCSSKMMNRPAKFQKVRAAPFDAEAFRQKRRDAAERRKAKQAARNRSSDIIDQIRNADNKIEKAFELLVPSSGKADTVAGELIRAINRIMYRDYNDGDKFYEGYGIETCADAVAFLCDKIPHLLKEFQDIAWRNLEGENYTDAINDIAGGVLDYIYDNPKLVVTPNKEDMFDFDGEEFIRDNEWEPEYEAEFDIPYSVYLHVEKGDLSPTDVQNELESWEYLNDDNVSVDVSSDGSYVSITGLKKDAYDEVEYFMNQWLEQYGDDLNDEFGDPEEEYDEEEE